MRKTIIYAAVVVAVHLVATGCRAGKSDPAADPAASAVALEVGDQKFTQEDLGRFFGSRIGELVDHAEMNALKSQLLQDFIDEKLLDAEARAANITAPDDQVQQYLMQMNAERKEGGDTAAQETLRGEVAQTLRIQQYVRDHLGGSYTPTAAEIQKYYQDNADEFRQPDRVHVQEILVNSADQAERLLSLLKANQYRNFSELARLYSIAPSAANGGDMGLFARGDLPEEMEKIFFNTLVPGRVSGIIQTRYGYHIFLLVERTRAYRERLDDSVRERIVTTLREAHQKRLLAEKLQELRQSRPVRIYRERLDFGYNDPQSQSGGSNP